ncbi:N-acetyl-alpha-D-glucosaminyl L-malate synthase BshA [Flavobacteriaceae bacterium]|nr:N-acetyl-alpha-D-glucosaminyl L-malate synthase BshA [Flavobacteriaceae bacterium]MDB4147974.1 N-acetyl-alpha-D-glucosaminyl L-malate synthase BshA [bacterium]MDB9849225.1 N-acetyl-alpha-D-glucosaminyl L-malate synthase BshA [Flavobacteriaceae bacterium]MDC1337179.1 N-acetyl-alpha-D-glucosaminyl L-malate synthase BshA [Flavobacteriaceae bacterium]
MKIAIVCYPTFGGSGVMATELGMSLVNHGHEVHFIAYKKPVRLTDLNNKLHFHKVNVPDYPLFSFVPYELALSTKLVDVVKNNSIDVLHVHYAIPHAYAAYMAKKMLKEQSINIPIVTTLHGTDITLVGNHPSYKTAVTFSINKSDIVTCVSQSLKEDTLDQFEIKNDIKVIPNFIDINKYMVQQDLCLHENPIPVKEFIISHVSNFRPVKNIANVIKIFYNIQKELKSQLIMIGEGPDKSLAEDLCKELGISHLVKFLGNTNQVEKNLCHSDLFLLPSSAESFGLAALEAMASKVAVISSDSGGLPEININGETGYVENFDNVDEMSRKAISILSSKESLDNFKNKAFLKAKEFDINKIVPLYEKTYQDALDSIK